MRFLLVLVLAASASADRASFQAALRDIEAASFETLEPDARDRLFEALIYDDAAIARPLAEVISRYGTYLSGVEGRMELERKKLARFTTRQGLAPEEEKQRKDALARLRAVEAEWTRALASLDLLAERIGALESEKTIGQVVRRFLDNPTWRVRYVLARGAGDWHRLSDDRLSASLFKALEKLAGDEEALVRVVAARSLGAFARPRAIEILTEMLQDPDWRVRNETVRSLAAAETSAAVGALVAQLQRETGRLREDIMAALTKVTGETHRYPELWERWWRSVGETLPGEKPPPAEPGRHVDGQRFYGIPTLSDRICFVIDVSGSMVAPVDDEEHRRVTTGGAPSDLPAGSTRLDVAKSELKRAIGNLASTQQFTIVFFNHAVKSWRPVPVKATPEAKADAYEAIAAMQASGTTYTLGALREAFAIAGAMPAGPGLTAREGPGLDTIYLLSDGAPTGSDLQNAALMDPAIILEAVRGWNRDQGVVIHAIAVDVDDNYFLRTLAEENGGEFAERK